MPHETKEPRVHRLKTWATHWDQIERGTKKFELRLNDRDYKVGDVLELVRVSDHAPHLPTEEHERYLTARVTYVTTWTAALRDGFVAMGIEVLRSRPATKALVIVPVGSGTELALTMSEALGFRQKVDDAIANAGGPSWLLWARDVVIRCARSENHIRKDFELERVAGLHDVESLTSLDEDDVRRHVESWTLGNLSARRQAMASSRLFRERFRIPYMFVPQAHGDVWIVRTNESYRSEDSASESAQAYTTTMRALNGGADGGSKRPADPSYSDPPPSRLKDAWVVYHVPTDMWWRPKGNGYVRDLLGAGVFTESEAQACASRRSPMSDGSREDRALRFADALRGRGLRDGSVGSLIEDLREVDR
jgi:hypothetical protein